MYCMTLLNQQILHARDLVRPPLLRNHTVGMEQLAKKIEEEHCPPLSAASVQGVSPTCISVTT